jgi:uncharacterized protein involved in exopolysaccharide biosynthesis
MTEENPVKLREEQVGEVTIMDYVNVVWKRRYFIILLVALAVLVTAAASVIMTPTFESKALISPVSQAQESASVSFLAAQFGITPPTPTSLSEINNLLNSNILREKILKKYDLLPILIKEEILKKMSENEKTWEGIRRLRDSVKITPRVKESILEVSAQFRDPKLAAQVVGYFLTELTEHMSAEVKRVAGTNKMYLESQIDKTADPFIRGKIYGLIAQQIEKSMMAEVKENFAFKVLDPPRVPDKRSSPRRTQMVILAFVVSLFACVFLAFGSEYIERTREKNKKTIMEERP